MARGTLPAVAGPAPELRDPHPDGLREPLPGWEHGDPAVEILGAEDAGRHHPPETTECRGVKTTQL